MSEGRYVEVSRSTVNGRLELLRLLDNEKGEIVEISRDADGTYLVRRGSENGGLPRGLNPDDRRHFGGLIPNDVKVTAGRRGFGVWLRDRFRRLGG